MRVDEEVVVTKPGTAKRSARKWLEAKPETRAERRKPA